MIEELISLYGGRVKNQVKRERWPNDIQVLVTKRLKTRWENKCLLQLFNQI